MKCTVSPSTGAVGAPLAGNIRPGAQGGAAASLNLIHTNNSPNPAAMRVAARFEPDKALGLSPLTDRAATVAWLMGWRAAHGAKSTA